MNSLDDSLTVNHPMSSRNKLLCTFIFYSLPKLTSPIVWYLLEGPERHVLTQKRPHAKHEILSSPSDICEKAQRSSLSWDWVVSSAVCLSLHLSHIFQAQFWWKTCSVGFFTRLIQRNYKNRTMVSCMSSHPRRQRKLVYCVFVAISDTLAKRSWIQGVRKRWSGLKIWKHNN